VKTANVQHDNDKPFPSGGLILPKRILVP